MRWTFPAETRMPMVRNTGHDYRLTWSDDPRMRPADGLYQPVHLRSLVLSCPLDARASVALYYAQPATFSELFSAYMEPRAGPAHRLVKRACDQLATRVRSAAQGVPLGHNTDLLFTLNTLINMALRRRLFLRPAGLVQQEREEVAQALGQIESGSALLGPLPTLIEAPQPQPQPAPHEVLEPVFDL